MSTKTLRGFEIKSEAEGTVTAVFATLGVKDSDGDVTVDGAFEDGAEVVISSYGHKSWDGKLPVGKGTIQVVGSEAVLNGRFFLDTEAGKDTFTVVKELGPLGQWSYGYDALKYSFGDHNGERVRFLEELKVWETSPVLVGAGVNTRTLAAKSAGLRFGEHAAAVLADVEALAARAADVLAMRAEKGKGLADGSAELLGRVEAELKRLAEVLAPGVGDDADELRAAAEAEFLQFVRRSA